MKPNRCTLLLSICISTSLHVSGNYVPIIRRIYCSYATLVFFTLYGWLSGLQTRQPPTQSEKYRCRIHTVVILTPVSFCLQTNFEMVPKIPSCYCMLLMWRSRLSLIEIKPFALKLEILISNFQIICFSINET